MDFCEIEKKLNYTFKDKNLLKRAFTLSSFDNDFNNQTLEFFGDAILEFIVSEKIYEENALNATEGELTKRRANIVCDNALKSVSERIGLDKFLIKSPGDTNNQKAVPSVYEAVVAAIFLDGGLGAAKKFACSTLDWNFTEINYKGGLQEFLQADGKDAPKYETINIGNVRSPQFKAEVKIDGKPFYGVADNKQQAEQTAAKQALKYLKK